MYKKFRRINVITPTYNDAHLHLFETVLSVQRQIFDKNNLEVIHTIIDDGTKNKDSSRNTGVRKDVSRNIRAIWGNKQNAAKLEETVFRKCIISIWTSKSSEWI